MTPQNPPTAPPHQDKVLKGIASGVAAFFLLSLMGVFVKLLGETHHVIEVAFYRNLIPLAMILAYIGITRKTHLLRSGKPLALFFRVIVGTLALITTFAAINALPLADATVLFFTSTLIVPVLSFFLLKEHMGIHRWSAIIIGMSGVLIMASPSGNGPALGVALALCAAFMHAVIQVFLRHLKTENSVTVTLYFMLGGTLIPALFLPWIGTVPHPDELGLLLGVGLSGGLAQYYLTSAFRMAPATVISPFNYTGLIWASAFDILIWNIVPGWPVFAGAAVIMASNMYVIHRERLHEKNRKKSG